VPDDIQKKIDQIIDSLPKLTKGQVYWVEQVIESFKSTHEFKVLDSKLVSEDILKDFGYALLIHHTFSNEPFSKDKFEYVLVRILEMHGVKSDLAPRGNPGHDITINNTKVSLKTQADRNIKEDYLWISKFMELGKGDWGDNPIDLELLLNQFLTHLQNYDRILILRSLSKKPDWHYELVEIPIELLREAENGELEMKTDSIQYPKPGYCYVKGPDKELKYQLYFDGGSERKLQIKKLDKKFCRVHCEWKFTID
jgi:type II restriction enzyme